MLLKYLVVLLVGPLVTAQPLPEHKRNTGTACVESAMKLASCPDNTVIAIEDINAGVNLISRNCPETYRDIENSVCCSEKPDDCLFRLYETGYNRWYDDCSGRQECMTAGAQADTVSNKKCENIFMYGNLTQYISMYYYCIDESNIQGICTEASRSSSSDLLFLQTDTYPTGQSADTACKCSIEVDECGAGIEIYIIHLDFNDTNGKCGSQRLLKLSLTDGDIHLDYDCSNGTNTGISNMTTNTSYITMELKNPDNYVKGRFWIGFRVSSSTASLNISCPAVQQTYCRGCDALSSIANGSVSHDGGLSVGRSAVYSCLPGYRLAGNETRTCLNTGNWSGSEPSCEIIMCTPLDDMANGTVSEFDNLLVGQTAEYNCYDGFILVGPAIRTCLHTGLWSGDEPFCSRPDCPVLNVDNGNVTVDGYTVGSKARYECDLGYLPADNDTKTCQESGSWSGDAPQCTIVKCGPLETPEGSSVEYSRGTLYQSVATYKCNAGYSVIGDPTRECQANGTWTRTSNQTDAVCVLNADKPALQGLESFRIPVCVDSTVNLADCSKHNYTVVAIENIMAGANLRYRKCPASYQYIDVNSTDCCKVKPDDCKFQLYKTGYENWHKKCSGLTKCLIPGAQFDTTSEERCRTEFYSEDYETLTQYMFMDYYCISRSEMYGVCTPTTHEIVSEDIQFLTSDLYPKNSTARQSCNCSIEVDDCYAKINIYTIHLELKNINGNCDESRRIHISDGDSVLELSCVDDSFQGISVSETKTTYITFELINPEATIDYKFWFGFGASRKTAPLKINCPAVAQARCMNCPPLGDISNGKFHTEDVLSTGVNVTYMCDTGYKLIGYDIRTCLENGTWSGSEPHCKKEDCGLLEVPEHGHINYSSSTTYGSVATYSCDTPYVVFGNPQRECLETAKWSLYDPSCGINDCDPLDVPQNGSLVYFRGANGHIWTQLVCDQGFYRVGTELRECKDDMSWSEEQQYCQIIDCHEFDAPENGIVTFSDGTSYPSVAVISCKTGYTLLGSNKRQCGVNGSCSECGVWSTSESFCRYQQQLPLEVLSSKTVCKGDKFEPLCPLGRKLIIQNVLYGIKPGSSCESANCCEHDPSRDCMLPYTETNIHSACSGLQYCDVMPASTTNTEWCGNSSPGINHYTVIEYYCVDRTKILPLCSSGVLKDSDRLMYIYNREYPTSIAASDRNCACSVETTDCTSNINMYAVHFQLTDGDGPCEGYQKVYTQDQRTEDIQTCFNNTNYTITKKMTSKSNYLNITLDNSYSFSGGNIWLGLEATVSSSSLQINCPALPQSRCMDCPPLKDINNGTVLMNNGTSTGQTAMYMCEIEYNLKGDSERVCQENGTWTGKEPECELKKCPKLNPVENGSVPTDRYYTIGQKAVYKCDEGFEISGSAERLCQLNETWSVEEPTCPPIECEALSSPDHGQVDPEGKGVPYKMTANYTCDDGFYLEGEATRTCQSDGSWTGSDPDCKEKTCPQLKQPENGECPFMEGIRIGNVVVCNCLTGYILSGDGLRRCLSNYTWSGKAPSCDPVACTTNVDCSTVFSGAVCLGGSCAQKQVCSTDSDCPDLTGGVICYNGICEPKQEAQDWPLIPVVSGSGAVVLIAVITAVAVCIAYKRRLNRKSGDTDRSRPLPDIQYITPIPPRRQRPLITSEGLRRSRSFDGYHMIRHDDLRSTDIHLERIDRLDNKNKIRSANIPKPEILQVDKQGYLEFPRTESDVLREINENRAPLPGIRYNELNRQYKTRSYEVPMNNRNVWPQQS